MIRLLPYDDYLMIVLAGAVTTNQLQIVTNFSEKTPIDYVGGAFRTNSNNTTDTTICLPPITLGNYIDVDGIHVHNRDTALANVTIKIDVSGTQHILWRGYLSPGDNLFWSRTCGWQITDSLGRHKVTTVTVTSSTDLYYQHDQSSPATTWNVNHSLGKRPSVSIVNGSGNLMLADVNYIDDNSLTVSFAAATAGKAYCN